MGPRDPFTSIVMNVARAALPVLTSTFNEHPTWPGPRPTVYFLINTCLTGLRSSEILSNEVSRVHHHRPDVEEREEKGREKGRWRANTCGGVLVRCHGGVWKRNSARGTRQAKCRFRGRAIRIRESHCVTLLIAPLGTSSAKSAAATILDAPRLPQPTRADAAASASRDRHRM
jgi:hypothetical protein